MTMPTFMTLDRIFIAFMTVCGLIFAGLVIFFPQSRNFGIPPYFWVLIVMALFEGLAFALGRGVITMPARLAGFAIAVALLLLLPYLAGQPVQLT